MVDSNASEPGVGQDCVLAPPAPDCLYCGEPECFEILEVWSDHTFMIETCCEGLHEEVCREAADDAARSTGRSGAHWLRDAFERATGFRTRRLAESAEHLLVDFDLAIGEIRYAQAADFVRTHHKHCRRPAGWKFGASISNGPTMLGVVMVGRPVSRIIQARGDTLEVNRLCLDRTLPDALRWNACSQLYAWAARECAARGYSKLITYTRFDELGTSLMAAGWVRDGETAGGSWARRGRVRASTNTVRKVRWLKVLTAKRPKQVYTRDEKAGRAA